MGSYDEILDQVPIDQLAGQLGVGSDEVRQAAEQALPALLGGLQANASDPAGADSLLAALSNHQGAVTSLGDVDEQDGRAIVGNIFGGNTDQVVGRLGGLSGTSGSLVQKLLPLLAPIVMSWLAKKMGQGGLGGMLGGGSGSTGTTGAGRERAPPTAGRSSPAGRAPTADRCRRRAARPRRARPPAAVAHCRTSSARCSAGAPARRAAVAEPATSSVACSAASSAAASADPPSPPPPPLVERPRVAALPTSKGHIWPPCDRRKAKSGRPATVERPRFAALDRREDTKPPPATRGHFLGQEVASRRG